METILAEFQTELNSTDLPKRDNKQNDKKLFAMFDLSLRENQTKQKENNETMRRYQRFAHSTTSHSH